jgi:methoxymalonate biosynthesis acyl carrier protein
MEAKEIEAQLRRFVRQRYGVPESDGEFSDTVNLFNYGYVDSFGAVDLYTFVQKEFSVGISEADRSTAPLNTIREISAFVAHRRKEEL